MSGGHGAVEGSNKRVALLISVLALFLAFSETLGKAAQTDAIGSNIEAANQWAFFQARTIRSTVLKTADEMVALTPPGPNQEAVQAKRAEWAKTMARWDSEPATGEGRKELAEKAKANQEKRDLSLHRYHHYELASAAFQIGIVLASAQVITGIVALAVAGGLLGAAGAVMLGFGFLAPHALHLF
ncbi:DUF4337 domain-containing protein [Methylobacterium gregans]|uniref:DUF4337 domain-containing protein n=1 Tax=Methylobacterium gregans TaxID=374424 RepID=A0AA37HJZ1_9HYPH|nr:DUF4337 domain-containing protein [Methylobacterium gregans]MDQ0519815.1 hypothetical protein [Methylobacterium gregans]GJD76973.1 hypothetical protein NBEOAGPD_0174 [Methylobacterium gregans]GLS54063.1 hypothetical protein GCM10007886_22460 [Methylobacterium gregans]